MKHPIGGIAAADNDDDDGIVSDGFQTRDAYSNGLGSFEGRSPEFFPSDEATATQQKKNKDDFETRGSIVFESKLHNDPEENSEGAVISMEQSDMKLYCSIPSTSGCNYFASFMGRTAFMKLRGFATTNLSLGYRIWDGISFLVDWTTVDGLSKVRFTNTNNACAQISKRLGADLISGCTLNSSENLCSYSSDFIRHEL
jgi:hypothetical protein